MPINIIDPNAGLRPIGVPSGRMGYNVGNADLGAAIGQGLGNFGNSISQASQAGFMAEMQRALQAERLAGEERLQGSRLASEQQLQRDRLQTERDLLKDRMENDTQIAKDNREHALNLENLRFTHDKDVAQYNFKNNVISQYITSDLADTVNERNFIRAQRGEDADLARQVMLDTWRTKAKVLDTSLQAFVESAKSSKDSRKEFVARRLAEESGALSSFIEDNTSEEAIKKLPQTIKERQDYYFGQFVRESGGKSNAIEDQKKAYLLATEDVLKEMVSQSRTRFKDPLIADAAAYELWKRTIIASGADKEYYGATSQLSERQNKKLLSEIISNGVDRLSRPKEEGGIGLNPQVMITDTTSLMTKRFTEVAKDMYPLEDRETFDLLDRYLGKFQTEHEQLNRGFLGDIKAMNDPEKMPDMVSPKVIKSLLSEDPEESNQAFKDLVSGVGWEGEAPTSQPVDARATSQPAPPPPTPQIDWGNITPVGGDMFGLETLRSLGGR